LNGVSAEHPQRVAASNSHSALGGRREFKLNVSRENIRLEYNRKTRRVKRWTVRIRLDFRWMNDKSLSKQLNQKNGGVVGKLKDLLDNQ
jgi:hypothetical protein